MIQCLLLRDGSKGKYETGFDLGMRAASVEEIFADPKKFITGKLEKSQQYNVYYTISDCLEEPGRKLDVQHHIPFDVDKLELPFDAAGNIDTKALWITASVACQAIGVAPESCGILFSGNGLQIIVGITEPIRDAAYFDQVRRHYRAICDRINLRLIQAKIAGEADPSVWSPARLMRYPETLNRKAGKPERMGIMLNSKIERTDFNLTKASGLPDVGVKDAVAQSICDAFPTPDVKTIMDPEKGCKFLHWVQTHSDKVSEPEWYAAVSITARFPEGDKFTHKMSEDHPKYSYEETQQKIQQALDASGPRTCKNIDAISGGKCAGCKHKNTKLATPLLIEGPDHIKTAKSGFHNVYVHPETQVIKIGKPNYEDLRRFFAKQYDYVSVETAKAIWTFNGRTFSPISRDVIESFALKNFDPKCNTSMRSEFFEQVRLNNVVSADWFSRSVEGKMNFQNGVLDVKSGVVAAHSKEYGFRSLIPCDYTPDAKAPRFMQFMNEVTGNRTSLVECIQEYLGYAFANGRCTQQKALFLLGDGSNGKSTLMKVIRTLAGDQGVSSLSLKDMNKEETRSRMEGKLLNIGEENARDSFKDTEAFKKIVAGDPISARKLYTDGYEYENRTKLVILCNELPASTDLTNGFFRRMIIIPFDQIFSDEKGNMDRDIDAKLACELPGIANWIMEGYKRLIKQGKITVPQKSNDILAEYRKEVDLIADFTEEYLEVVEDESFWCNKQELYNAFKKHCDDMGSKYLPSQKKFFMSIKRRMEHQNIEPKDVRRTKDNGERYWAFINLRYNGKTLA